MSNRLSAGILPGITVALALTALAAGAQSAFAQERELLDRIVAIVDTGVVLQSEVDSRLADIITNARRNNQPEPDLEAIYDDVLDALVLENLQMQIAERINIRFDDDTINRVLGSMAENSNMSFEQYITTLEQAGVYLQTREQVRRQMTLQELQRGLVNQRIRITDQEIENFINSDMGQELMQPDYFLDHMMVPFTTEEDETIRQQKIRFAGDLVARLEGGEDFAALRAESMQGGEFPVTATEFGWRNLDQIPALFTDTVEGMSVGGIEGPFEAPNGLHIIQLSNQRGGTSQFVQQTHLRHIMLSPNEIRDEEQSLEEIRRMRQRILEGDDFAVIARQNSDDAASVVAGGDLDWINEGGMPISWEAAIADLEVGELSEPVRTDTGWHLIEVLGRRLTDLSQEFIRAEAENMLRNRKFDLELQNWLIEIREEAFVEYVE